HREHPFGLVECPAEGGLAFRAVQAKRAGLAFGGVCLAVRLDACGSWLRERQRTWPADLEHLDLDWAERYAFEHADAQFLPSPPVAAPRPPVGWAVRAGARAAPAGRAAAPRRPAP